MADVLVPKIRGHLEEQLAWNSSKGEGQKHIVISREFAEYLMEWMSHQLPPPPAPERVPVTLNEHAKQCHRANDKWWRDPHTGERIERNKGELFMLMVTELCEAFEGERKDLMDSHLPHRKAVEVELADELIRLFDYAGRHKLDIEGAYWEKREFNRTRPDHSFEARRQPGGKKW
jgi:NTP pyrophosphatase (non-canonical NTP hydrolase)